MTVYLLPISHVAGESRSKVAWAIETLKPQIVAVELDGRRLTGLLEAKNRKYFDWKRPKESLIAIVFQSVQQFFSKKTGEVPGEEFLVAVRSAARANIEIALIDRDISITLAGLSKAMTLGTIGKFIWLLLFGKRTDVFDLNSVPEEKLVLELLRELKKEFPRIHKALVADRDSFMAARIKELPEEKAVLVIVGAAHVPGMRKKLRNPQII